MSYEQAIQFLYGLRLFGAKLGLENIRRLAALAGNPHERLRFIHVAGTNGKGSTCAMLESVYRAAGLRVGLFTSPHLVHFGERLQVDRQLIRGTDVTRLLGELIPLLKSFPAEAHPTFFEVVTVMALKYFVEQRCELVIWETGLGGRLDATNIVTPLASVITNVQYDHQQWLGDTLAKIASEKAGISKPGVPFLTAAAEPEALEVIARTARERAAPLTVVRSEDTRRSPLDQIELPLLGEHQRFNAALAVATVRALAKQLPVPEASIRAGLERVRWPGRLQVVKRARATGAEAQTIVLDGAHNPAGASALAEALRTHFAGTRPVLVLGLLQDKDWEAMCRILAPLAERIIAAPVNSRRSAAPEAVVKVCRQANPGADVAFCHSLQEALDTSRDAALVVVSGSLYFIGEAMELLALSAAPPADERALNEWQPAATADCLPNR
jgi:dihydrofolate synthase/folylpolyglutamate synthase